MPLRDHFRPPLDDDTSWEGLHGQWPGRIVAHLNRDLPPRYIAAPRVRLGATFEIDVAASEKDVPLTVAGEGQLEGTAESGPATAVWIPPCPTLDLPTDLPEQDEYEVRIYDAQRRRRLVAAIELASPANKDRPENRRAFVTKCAALLREGVSVSIIDVVTTRQFNLYGDLLEQLALPRSGLEFPPIYAVACRWQHAGAGGRWRSWGYDLAVGSPLPTLPVWLTDDFAVPLDLEASYEEACRELRIA
jgi:hypothetical protein